jgi:hypothetical protein
LKEEEILANDTHLFEMSNLRKQDTGLPINVYVSSGGSVNKQHRPRIKVMRTSADKMNPHETIGIILKKNITLDDVVGYDLISPKTFEAIRRWVHMNYETLVDYWNDEISTVEMIGRIKSL